MSESFKPRNDFKLGDFINAHSLRIPSYIYGSAWIGHAPFINWLVAEQKPSTFVELGTHLGYSFFSVCETVRAAELRTKCFAIDHWRGDKHAGTYGDEIYREVKARNESSYGDFSRLIQSTFFDALHYFDSASIDLLHIDGRHYYEDVREDFESWLPKMKKDSIVLFHDISVRERNFGVFKYWNELKYHYQSFEFQHCNGLGILCLGRPTTPLLEKFFNLQNNKIASSLIQNTYMRLGASIDDHRKILQVRRLKKKFDELTDIDERLKKIEKMIEMKNDSSI